MKRSWIKRKTPLKRSKTPLESKIANKGYKVPKWFLSIKPGSHGNTPAQKRLWRVVSETYRKQDWEVDMRCRTCSCILRDWKEGQLGHYKAWGACNSWFKYHRINLALQCSVCNANFQKTNTIGGNFLQYLQTHYKEKNIGDWIEKENQKYIGIKMQEWELVDYAAKLRPDLVINTPPSTTPKT